MHHHVSLPVERKEERESKKKGGLSTYSLIFFLLLLLRLRLLLVYIFSLYMRAPPSVWNIWNTRGGSFFSLAICVLSAQGILTVSMWLIIENVRVRDWNDEKKNLFIKEKFHLLKLEETVAFPWRPVETTHTQTHPTVVEVITSVRVFVPGHCVIGIGFSPSPPPARTQCAHTRI